MTYSAIDVAKYVITYSNQQKYRITNSRLQRLLYFIQGYFFSNDTQEPCFYADFVAWRFGPTVSCVYEEFKQFGSLGIPNMYWDDYELDYKTKKKVKNIVDYFAVYSDNQLSEISKKQTPWIEAFELQERKIRNSTIQKFFLRMKRNCCA